jgi:putative N6-adenine-specific DNA methylase
LEEVKALTGGAAAVESVPGGVGFQGQLVDCYRANLHLRTAGRVLMRIETFRATRFDRMAARLAEIPWELYLPPDAAPTVSVTAKRCRLHHSDAIAERVTAAIRSRLEGAAGEPEETEAMTGIAQRVFVRGIEDGFTISMDSSGEPLHKRSVKVHGGPAPLRETLAAAALQWAGYSGQEPLIDPMCGTGTFSLEGALMAAHIAPGLFRNFAFMGWPSFQPVRWDHLKREAAAARRHAAGPQVFASDISESACRLLERTVQGQGLADLLQVAKRDFFGFNPMTVSPGRGTVALNPPYGHRLEADGGSGSLFKAICRKLGSDYRGWRLVLVVPGDDLVREVPFRGNVLPFQHGGGRRLLVTGRIR